MNAKIVAITVALIFVISIVSALFIPGEEKREFIRIDRVDIRVKSVNESHVDFLFIVYMYRSEMVKNATVHARIYDLKTNVLLKDVKKEIRESFYEYSNETLNVTLRKDKDYRVVFEVKKDEKPVDSRVINLRNLDTLIPRDKELRVILKDADFRVVGVDNRTVRVQVRFYLESMDDYDILFHVKAIQYESNVLADERWVSKKVKSGATTLVYCNITVPRDYNYLIKLEAWRNGSLLKTWKNCLNLAPKKRIPKEEVEEEVKFRVEEFVKTPIPLPTPTPLPYRAKEGKIPMAPGFEALLLIIALGGVVFCLRRRR